MYNKTVAIQILQSIISRMFGMDNSPTPNNKCAILCNPLLQLLEPNPNFKMWTNKHKIIKSNNKNLPEPPPW